MKKFFFLPVLLIACIAGQAQSSDATLYLTKTLSADNISQVEVKTSGGGIKVTGGDASAARIEVYVSGNGNRKNLSKEEIKSKLEENYELTITSADHKLTAIARNKKNHDNWRDNLNISFVIFVPVNTATDLNTSGGGITLSNLTGHEEFTTSGGGLHLEKLTGHINGSTSGGGIHLTDLKDDINLTTSGGGIEALRCSGKIRLSTSGGSLDLQQLDGNIFAETSGGGVHGDKISGEFETHSSGGGITLSDIDASLEASTSGGNINVEMNGIGKYVKLGNSGGSINLLMPKNKGLNLKIYGDRVKVESLTDFSGTQDENSIRGTVGGGGVPVVADAGGGRVNLSFK